jgi:hypothetical protein
MGPLTRGRATVVASTQGGGHWRSASPKGRQEGRAEPRPAIVSEQPGALTRGGPRPAGRGTGRRVVLPVVRSLDHNVVFVGSWVVGADRLASCPPCLGRRGSWSRPNPRPLRGSRLERAPRHLVSDRLPFHIYMLVSWGLPMADECFVIHVGSSNSHLPAGGDEVPPRALKGGDVSMSDLPPPGHDGMSRPRD